MATVRITENLMDEVGALANRVFGDGPKITDYLSVENDTATADAIYDKMFDGYKHHMEALPEKFFLMADSIDVLSAGGYRINASLAFSQPKRMPYNYECNGSMVLSNYRTNQYAGDACISLNSGAMPELERKAKEFSEKLEGYMEERKAFVKSVKTLLGKYSTLNPALKEWPPLWDLLPEEVKERHRRVVERKSSKAKPTEDVELDMDLNKMTSKVVAAKVRG